MKRYVPITVGIGLLGLYISKRIRPEYRKPGSEATKWEVSPADGKVLTFGKITSCQVEQVKGVTYSLQQFLGDQSWKDSNNNKSETGNGRVKPMVASQSAKYGSDAESEGREKLSFGTARPCIQNENNEEEVDPSSHNSFSYVTRLKEKENTELYHCVVYLAPGDYHRFHSPVSWRVNFRRHFHGKLLSVNPAIASWIGNLFSLNERAAYIGSWYHGFFSLTAVGATNVGSIRVQFDPSLRTNQWKNTPNARDCFFNEDCKGESCKQNSVEISKGELFGEFRLGSTIVLIFEAPKNFQFDIETGQKVKYGQKIGVCC